MAIKANKVVQVTIAAGALALGALPAMPARAGDAGQGREIAQQQCAACHVVGRDIGREIANAPPFEVIGRKNGFNEGAIALNLRGPHPKMNFAITGPVADDVAAYIATLGR